MQEQPKPRPPRAGWRASILVVALSSLAFMALRPEPLTAQHEAGSWRRGLQVSARALYDSNVFRLSDSQRAGLGSVSAQERYVDMSRPEDVVLRVKLAGELRGQGLGTAGVRLGGGIQVDAFTSNTRLTHLQLETFVAKALSSRDELTLELDYRPDEFRRNYLIEAEPSSPPTYAAGVSNQGSARFRYERRVRRGKGRDLNVQLAAAASRRSFSDFPWRDRTELSGAAALQMELGQHLDVEVRAARGLASHDGSPEPFIEASLLRISPLNRDFAESELGVGVHFRTAGRAELLLGWERRIRDYVAVLGEDPVYGDRRDDRDAFEVEVRVDRKGPVQWRIGGMYRYQDTFRPAKGDAAEEQDYKQTRVFVALRYVR